MLDRTPPPSRRFPLALATRLARGVAWGSLAVAAVVLLRAEVLPVDQPEGVTARRGIEYRRSGNRSLRLDLYQPAIPPPGDNPALVVIHGGGWRGGSRGDFGREMARFAQHGLTVAAIDYTLSRPGVPSWPANRDDVREAVRWVRRHAAELRIDPQRIAVLGASAGGHLAALLGVDPGDDQARVQAVVALYGPMDLSTLGAACLARGGPVDLLLGGLPAELPERAASASPLRFVNVDTPPMLFVHGGDDIQVDPDQSRQMAKALARARVSHEMIVLEGAAHGFGLRVGELDLLPEILAFLEGAWNDGRQAR